MRTKVNRRRNISRRKINGGVSTKTKPSHRAESKTHAEIVAAEAKATHKRIMKNVKVNKVTRDMIEIHTKDYTPFDFEYLPLTETEFIIKHKGIPKTSIITFKKEISLEEGRVIYTARLIGTGTDVIFDSGDYDLFLL